MEDAYSTNMAKLVLLYFGEGEETLENLGAQFFVLFDVLIVHYAEEGVKSELTGGLTRTQFLD